jgi:hypothetical protein
MAKKPQKGKSKPQKGKSNPPKGKSNPQKGKSNPPKGKSTQKKPPKGKSNSSIPSKRIEPRKKTWFEKILFDNFNTSKEIREVNNYSIYFFKEFSNMIRTVYNFIQDSFFNITSTEYTILFTTICVLILFSIILFSKNKPKDIFIVVYFAIGFGILLAIKFVLKFLMICIDHIKALFNQFKKLWDRRNEMTRINSFKDFFYFIYNFGGTFFAIMITLFLLAMSVLIAGAICIGIQLLFFLSKSVFNAINGMSDSDDSIDTTQVVKLTFGSAFQESLERL